MGLRRLAAAAALAIWAAVPAGPAVLAGEPGPSPGAPRDAQQACRSVPPIDGLRTTARLACDVAVAGPEGPARDVQQTAADAGQAVADAAEVAFTRWLANGAAWVIQGVSQKVMGSSTTPNLDPRRAAMFADVYGRVVGVALSLSILLVLIGVIEAVLTRHPGALRRVLIGIAVSGIGMGAVPVATAMLVRVIDDLSWYVAADQSQVVTQGFATMIQLLLETNPANGAAAFALTALGIMLGGALLWLELVVRESLIYLFLGVVPLACAAVQWPRLEGVLRAVLFGGLALILSKLLIAIALAVGFSVLAAGAGLENLLGGMFILAIAALMPFATARVLPLAAEEMSQRHEGRMRGWAVAGAAGVGTTTRVVTAVAGQIGGALRGPVPLAPPMGSSGAGRTAPRGSGSAAAATAVGGSGPSDVQPTLPAPPRAGRPHRHGGSDPPESWTPPDATKEDR